MRVKSYFARTVEDAVATARQELGPDAMLLNSRKALPESRELGEYEVVFATDLPAESATTAPSQRTTPSRNGHDRLSDDVADLKRELAGMRRALTRSAFGSSRWLAESPDLNDAYAALTANEVNPDLAREIVQCAGARLTGARQQFARRGENDLAAVQKALLDELESRVAVAPELGSNNANPRTVALVGPPGCGKTTTLVKLAVNYGLSSRRPALFLSADTYRVAAAEQLRSYAAILGVGFQVVETVTALAQTIEEHRAKDLILIDTPGFGFGDLDYAGELADFLSSRSDVDTQLVLSSSMKSTDVTRIVDAYECFRPQRLLFTKLDETGSFGPILNESARTGKALSFFGTGQRIPEDLEAATRDRIAELVLTGHLKSALSVA
jgi:flagellar biosynthesis protein FlhF